MLSAKPKTPNSVKLIFGWEYSYSNGCVAENGLGSDLLETDHVLFQGEYDVNVLFNEIVGVSANHGRLTVLTDTAELQLQLRPVAERWKQKIEHPPSLLNKLGIKPGVSIAAVGPCGEDILRLLKVTLSLGKANLVFLGARPRESFRTAVCGSSIPKARSTSVRTT